MAVQQTSLEIAHRVCGGEDFLNVTRRIGQDIFGEDTTNGVVMDELERDFIVGALRFAAYSKLMLPVVQIAAPENCNIQLHYGAQRLEDQKDPAINLRNNLHQLALAHDIPDQNNIVLYCDSIALTKPPHKDKQELALVPDIAVSSLAVGFFVGEHELISQALRDNVRLRDKLTTSERYTPVLPFGALPENAGGDELARVAALLKTMLPLRLVVGKRLPPMVR